jgi:hypothetical protein
MKQYKPFLFITINVPFATVRPFIFSGALRVALTELRAEVSRSRKRGKPIRSGTRGGRVKADSQIACRSHAVPLPCRALIHTCYAAPLPCSNSAVSFMNVHTVAGNIRLLVQQCNRSSFCSVQLPLFSSSMINGVWFHTGHLHLRLVCV